jgi:hypothetical protein
MTLEPFKSKINTSSIYMNLIESRFARNPHMVIFGCENAPKWILFVEIYKKN